MEVKIAEYVGAVRHISAIEKMLEDKHGCKPEDSLAVHVLGAAGEMAAAKFRNKYWQAPVDTFKNGGDVGIIQVRTRSKSYYDLMIRENDRDDDWFVLVTGGIPEFKIRGYILGKNAKQEKYLANYGGRGEAWFVPQSELLKFKMKTDHVAVATPFTDGNLSS